MTSFLEELIVKSAEEIKKKREIRKEEIKENEDYIKTLSSLTKEEVKENEDYIKTLSSLTIGEIKKEPDRLETKLKEIQINLSLICLKKIKNFIIFHDNKNKVKSKLNQFIQNLNHFILISKKINQIITKLNSNSKLNSILNQRNQIKLILNQISTLEFLVELPQFISNLILHHQQDQNIQNLIWNQAIDLSNQLNQIHLKFNQNPNPNPNQINPNQNQNLNQINPNQNPNPNQINPNQNQINSNSFNLINLIQIQVNHSILSLQNHLILKLFHSNLKLPLAIKIISTLRKLSFNLNSNKSLNEIQLRFIFLISRWNSLTQNLNQIKISTQTNSPNQSHLFTDSDSKINETHLKFLRRWIEIWRQFIGDTISIYSDIFIHNSSGSNLNLKLNQSSLNYSSKQFLNDTQTPLNYFLTQSLYLLNSILTHHLNFINSVSSLNSILTQLNYCGHAFGKYGFQFTSSILPLILNQLDQIIKLRIQSGLQQFQFDLKSIISTSPTHHSFNRSNAFQIRRRSINPFSINSTSFIPIENSLISPDSIHQVLKIQINHIQNFESELSMRNYLTFFPPLARFVNSQFTALNELRLLPSISSYDTISEAQFQSFKLITELFEKIASTLPDYSSLNESDHHLLQEFNLQDDTNEDQDKISQIRFRLVIHRMIFIWTKSVVPILEKSLRLGIYNDLSIESPHPRFFHLIHQCETLLSSIIPSHAQVIEIDQKQTEKLESDHHQTEKLESDHHQIEKLESDQNQESSDTQVSQIVQEAQMEFQNQSLEETKEEDETHVL